MVKDHMWELICLEIDRASSMVGDYFDRDFPVKPKRVSIDQKTYVQKESLIDMLENALEREVVESGKPTLTVYGHGKFHHYTYGLCRVLADRRSPDYGYIHFDQHHDMCGEKNTEDPMFLGCAGFVKTLKKDSNTSQLLTVGASNDDYPELPLQTRKRKKIPFDLDKFGGLIDGLPKDVYISFDLDVMHREEISTGYMWENGLWREELLDGIRIIKRKKNIIGADILGLSDTAMEPGMEEKSFSLYTDIAAELMGI